jgi:cytochrome c556
MRAILFLLLAAAAMAQAPAAEPAKPKPIGTISELMIDVIYPTSDDLFYIFREPPKNDVEWNKVRTAALTMAEAANLLMMPERRYDSAGWMDDAQLLLNVGRKAYAAAKAKDEKAIEDLNDELNTACVQCHMDYRPNYRRRPAGKQADKGK